MQGTVDFVWYCIIAMLHVVVVLGDGCIHEFGVV